MRRDASVLKARALKRRADRETGGDVERLKDRLKRQSEKRSDALARELRDWVPQTFTRSITHS